jgi:hypothetical protein
MHDGIARGHGVAMESPKNEDMLRQQVPMIRQGDVEIQSSPL